MAPTRNARVLFKQVPSGLPEPGKDTVYDDSKTIDLDTVPLDGKVLVKTLVLSLDPYLRSKMRAPDDTTSPNYQPAYVLGEPLYNLGVGKVIRSEDKNYQAGDYVYGILNFEEYTIPQVTFRKLDPALGLPWPVYVGAAGMPGQTADYAWKEHAEAKKGETVFVSAGAGPVGQMVIQLAKLDGLKVIASAGSEEKVQECKDAGADVAFNYKTESTDEILKKEGPLNIYWDNVGGPTLDAALINCATHARIIVCGMISTYNNIEEGTNLKNLWAIFGKSLHIHGFLVFDLAKKYEEEFYKVFPQKLAKKELKHREDITKGLDQAGHALVDILTGKNLGKKVIVVADD